jgi:hypothetical protein
MRPCRQAFEQKQSFHSVIQQTLMGSDGSIVHSLLDREAALASHEFWGTELLLGARLCTKELYLPV